MTEVLRPRVLEVPGVAAGMRLDRFLAARFQDWSRSGFSKAIKDGQVRDPEGRPLRASRTLKEGEPLHLWIPGIGATTEPPPFPEVLYEDDRVIVLDKPAGLVTHPAGTRWSWAVVSLAKERWPDERVDLVHRLDKDTSGTLVLTRDLDANRVLKKRFGEGRVVKIYRAVCRGHIPWDSRSLEGPIGSADGEIRIQMAVREDGLPARTDVEVLRRGGSDVQPLTWVQCRLFTGRTHQIRVHLAHAGFPLLGDRLYGVPEAVFLHSLHHGIDESVVRATGAERHALHAHRIRFRHPDGHDVEVVSPEPRWFRHPPAHPGSPGRH